ncbi:MAG: hypothetical protein JNL80_01475 [Phycisphaerae bacterium]|nr:hypothetical protein [Phycisphaerae bacterium]
MDRIAPSAVGGSLTTTSPFEPSYGDRLAWAGSDVVCAGNSYASVHRQDETGRWQPVALLGPNGGSPPATVSSTQFGAGLAADEHEIVVGEPGIGLSGNGRFHRYRRNPENEWTWVETVTPPPDIIAGTFGRSIAMDGQTLAVGADIAALPRGETTGLVVTYARGVDGALGAPQILGGVHFHFGFSVAVHGEWLVVGAPGKAGSVSGSASVMVFRRVNGIWQVQSTLGSMNATATRHGYAVAVSSDGVGPIAAVGAPEDNFSGIRSGRVRLYRPPSTGFQWDHVATLSGATLNDRFGASIDLKGDVLAVGSSGAFSGSIYSGVTKGKATLFERSDATWTPVYSRSGDPLGGTIGAKVALGETALLIGSRLGLDPGGSALVDFLAAMRSDCDGDGLSDAAEIAQQPSLDRDGDHLPDDCSPDCDGNGVPDVLQTANRFGCLVPVTAATTPTTALAFTATNDQERLMLVAYEVDATETGWIDGLWLGGGLLSGPSDARLCLWSDPNDDGNPSDGVLLRSEPVLPGGLDVKAYYHEPLLWKLDEDPVFVGAPGERYFVGVYVRANVPSGGGMRLFGYGSSLTGRPIWTYTGSAGSLDLADLASVSDALALATNSLPGLALGAMLRTVVDADGDGEPDTCACPADLNADGSVGAPDLAALLGGWSGEGVPSELGDIDGDGDTDAGDLAALLGAWGPCLP